MILLLDENMPPRVADALHALGTVEAYHVTKFLPRGASDMDVFELLREHASWVLVTQDRNITRRPQELAALRSAQVAAFVFTGKANRSLEEMLALLVSSLEQMRKKASTTARPFVYSVSDRRRYDRLV